MNRWFGQVDDTMRARWQSRCRLLALLTSSLAAGCGSSDAPATMPTTPVSTQNNPQSDAGALSSAATGTAGVATPAVTAGTGAAVLTPAGTAGSKAPAAVGGGGAGTPSSVGSNAGAVANASAGTTATAGASGATTATAGTAAPPDNGPRFPSVTDFTGPGPYKSTTVSNTGPNRGYTVYRPDMLAPGGAKNPIVGWMSGGSTDPTAYPLLPHLATHGFVVVASNTTPGVGEEVMLGKEIIAGIDWAIMENQRADSEFFGKLDETKIASMGYSMGALATFTIAKDPRLTTTIHISGGNMETERVKNLHAPAAFFCGIPGDANCNILSTDCDIAAANCDTDYASAVTPVFYANFPGGHLGILTAPNQDTIGTEVTAWLHWKLMQDAALETRFMGADCTVCKDSKWKKVQQKNF
jgi:dienelactone hydrolase